MSGEKSSADGTGSRLGLGGYSVTFHELAGGHTVPPEVADLGFRWWVDT